MGVQLNHTIVNVGDKVTSARFYADVLGLGQPSAFGPFLVLELANGVSLDFIDADEVKEVEHYAFLVSEEEWDAIFQRIIDRGLSYFADPGGRRIGEHNTHDGGRGVYWHDPDGHVLEAITVPYGGWPADSFNPIGVS